MGYNVIVDHVILKPQDGEIERPLKVAAAKPATHSRLLKIYALENEKRQKRQTGALTFRSMKGGGGNV